VAYINSLRSCQSKKLGSTCKLTLKWPFLYQNRLVGYIMTNPYRLTQYCTERNEFVMDHSLKWSTYIHSCVNEDIFYLELTKYYFCNLRYSHSWIWASCITWGNNFFDLYYFSDPEHCCKLVMKGILKWLLYLHCAISVVQGISLFSLGFKKKQLLWYTSIYHVKTQFNNSLHISILNLEAKTSGKSHA
jgi:hypothetical protein